MRCKHSTGNYAFCTRPWLSINTYQYLDDLVIRCVNTAPRAYINRPSQYQPQIYRDISEQVVNLLQKFLINYSHDIG